MKKILWLILLFAAPAAFGQGVPLPAYPAEKVVNGATVYMAPIPNATVTVCVGSAAPADGTLCNTTLPLATLYSNATLTTAATNPANADSNGNINSLYIASGSYVTTYSSTTAGVTAHSFAFIANPNGIITQSYTVAALPTPASTAVGTLVAVTNASVAGSCTVGGGTALALCRNSGSAWVPIGDGAGTTNQLVVLNVKTYGAVGDAQEVGDGTWTGTGPNFSSATAIFKSTDVGKIFWCNNASTALNSWGLTTIKTFNSATSITLNANAILSGGTTQFCVWATQDDTTALQAATTAAKVASNNSLLPPFLKPYSVNIYMPAGGYVVSGPPFNFLVATGNEQGIGLFGDGLQNTTIFPTPTFSQGALGGNQGFIVNGFGSGNYFHDFSINGTDFGYTNTGNTNVFNFICGGCVAERIGIYDYPILISAGILNIAGSQAALYNMFIQDNHSVAGLGNAISCQVNGASAVVMYRSTCSNNQKNLVISNETGSSLGSNFTFTNSVSDECGSPPCTTIATSKDVNIIGSIIWGTGGNYAMTVDGTSIVRLSQSFVAPYATNANGGGVQISSGGQVIATETQFGFNGTGIAVNGPAGAIFNDVGGNAIVACNANPCTPIPTTSFATHGFTGGINPVASLTHTWNTCYQTLAAFGAGTLCNQFADQNLQITHIKASSEATTTCATAPVVTITDGVNSATLTITTGKNSWDSAVDTSTGINAIFTSGNTITMSVTAGACATPPTNFNVTYNMQSVLNF